MAYFKRNVLYAIIKLAILSLLALSCSSKGIFPDCLNASDINPNEYMNSTSVQNALKLCFSRVKDPLAYHGYVDGSFNNITSGVVLNNIVSINEVDATVTLDIFHILEWLEPRLGMAAFWDQWLNQSNLVPEIELNGILEGESIDGVGMQIE
jgi:hypothetical protein